MKELFLRVFLHHRQEEIKLGDLAQSGRDIYFEYDADFIARQLEISPFRLRLKTGTYHDKQRMFQGLPGVFYDSLPDGWGLLLMDRYFRQHGLDPGSISPLERLAYIGERAMGALSYKPAMEISGAKHEYSIVHLSLLAAECEQVLQGSEEDILPELIIAGGSSGGARPKVLIGYNAVAGQMCTGLEVLPDGFRHYLIKFSAMTDITDSAEIEQAYALMAKACGIEMVDTQLFQIENFGRAFATIRFDRNEKNERIHMHSLAGLLHADFRSASLDYVDFLKATWLLAEDFSMVIEGFRRMVFNVFMHNRDDHSKNFSYLMTEHGWRLSPAYDLVFSSGIAGEHTMTVAGEGANPGKSQLLQVANQLEIPSTEALNIIDQVSIIRDQWLDFAEQAYVPMRSASRLKKVFAGLKII